MNNGVFVCFKCCDSHRVLGSARSLIRSTTMDSWNDQQLQYMQMGGNKKFSEFMEAYKLTSEPIAAKYKSKAADYYRKKVTLIMPAK